MFSTSAAICAIAVSEPWPISIVLVNTTTLPSALTFTIAPEVVGEIEL